MKRSQALTPLATVWKRVARTPGWFRSAALVSVVAVMVAACGSSSSSTSSASSASAGASSSTTASQAASGGSGSGGCGTSVPVGPTNPSGVYASLSPALKAIYASYPYQLRASPWATHKFPKPPWKIGFIGFPSINSYFVARLKSLETEFAAAKAQGLVTGSLVTSIPASPTAMTPESQISAIEQMVNSGVNLILLEPAAGTAVQTAIDAAGAKGVPVMLADALMPNSKYAIAAWTQNFAGADAGALGLIQKGNVLVVRGVQGNTDDTAVYNQAAADLKKCPNIHVAGVVYGQYDTATTKSVVQQFLASHPQPLSGVIEQGGMFAGTVEALQAVGKSIPPMAMVEPSGGELSYWLAHSSSYKGVAQGINGLEAGYTFMNAALRVLNGQEPKLNVIELPAPVITSSNLSTFAPSGQALTWPGEPLGSKTTWCDASCLNQYFVKPGGPSVS